MKRIKNIEINNNETHTYDFEVKEKHHYIMENGVISHNTSSGINSNATASFLPPHSKFNIQTLSKISVPIVPKYLKTRNWYYKSKFQYNPVTLIETTKRIQKWIDTGISMEVPINTELANMKEISDSFLEGFNKGTLKGVYYSITVDGKKIGCTDCAN